MVVSAQIAGDHQSCAELTEVAPEANRQKATVQVKVQIENADEYLRPALFVVIELTQGLIVCVSPNFRRGAPWTKPKE